MSTTALKLIALALMLADHIGEFIPGMPLWLRLLGRVSAPLFFFCAMWGYHYTRDRKAYLRRLYLCGLGMAAGNFLLNQLFPASFSLIVNNVFVTILLACLIVEIKEQLHTNRATGRKLLWAFVGLQVVSFALCMLSERLPLVLPETFVGAALPSLLYNEGGPIFVLMGVILYFNKDNKRKLAIGYGLFCAVYFALTLLNYKNAVEMGYGLTLFQYLTQFDYQWMMIFSLPLMLAYNGKKGAGFKWLFYIFYPAHIYVLFLIANLFL